MIILGATGSGKTYLSCAFGMEACKQGFTVRYVRLPELLEELAIARGEGCFKKAITQLKKVQLLIIDEWMLISLTETEARDLLELIHGADAPNEEEGLWRILREKQRRDSGAAQSAF